MLLAAGWNWETEKTEKTWVENQAQNPQKKFASL